MSQHDREPVEPEAFDMNHRSIEQAEDATARDTRLDQEQRADSLPLREDEEPDSMEAVPEERIAASPDQSPDPELGTMGTRADPMR